MRPRVELWKAAGVLLLLSASASAAESANRAPRLRPIPRVRPLPSETSAPAAAERPWSLAPRVGFLDPFSRLDAGLSAGLEARWVPPRAQSPSLGGHLGFGLDVAFAQSARSGSSTSAQVVPPAGSGAYSWSLSTQQVPIFFNVLYVEPLGSGAARLNAYGGPGVGWAYAHADASALGSRVSETGGGFAAQLLGGLGVGAGPGDFFGEVRFGWQPIAYLSTGHANLAGVALAIGYRFPF